MIAQAITISCENCVAITGMSWKWCVRFARAHHVPLWQIGPRKHVIPAQLMAAAMEAAAAAVPTPATAADESARIKREITASFRMVR